MRITLDDSFEKRWNWDIPGYPWDQLRGIPTYPDVYRLIPSYTKEGSRDISLQESYPCISQNKFSIPTYTGISRDRLHVGLSLDNSVSVGIWQGVAFPDVESSSQALSWGGVMKFSVIAWHRFLLLTGKWARRQPATALSPAATEFGVGPTES